MVDEENIIESDNGYLVDLEAELTQALIHHKKFNYKLTGDTAKNLLLFAILKEQKKTNQLLMELLKVKY